MKTLDEQIKNTKELLEYLEEQKEKGGEAVTEAEPESSKTWIPSIKDKYYFICFDGVVSSNIWYDDNVDIVLCSIGNVYRTYEDAEFEIERRKVEFELRKYIYEHGGGNGEFVVGRDNFSLCYGQLTDTLGVDNVSYTQGAGILCSSSEIFRAAVNAVGEDRVKKYYLRVKE